MLEADDYFDLSTFQHKKIFQDIEYVWEAIGKLEAYITHTISPNLGWMDRGGHVKFTPGGFGRKRI